GRPRAGPRLEVAEDVIGRDDALHEQRGKEEDEVVNDQRDQRDAMFADGTAQDIRHNSAWPSASSSPPTSTAPSWRAPPPTSVSWSSTAPFAPRRISPRSWAIARSSSR